MIKILLRILAVIMIGFVSAVIGLILGAIIGGNLAAMYGNVFRHELVFNSRVGYEATGHTGSILGALVGFAGSVVWLFGGQIRNDHSSCV